MNIIRQWGLEAGDKLEWSWEARDNEMIVIVRKANPDGDRDGESITKTKSKRKKLESFNLLLLRF